MTRRLLLCEGPDDVAFFKALLNARRDIPQFKVEYTSLKKGGSGGNSKFEDFIKGYPVQYGKEVYNAFQDLLIVSDNDDNPNDSYLLVKGQIEKALGVKLTAKRTFAYKKQFNNFRVKVLMIPWDDEAGNLETLCFDPAKDADAGLTDKVNRFQADVRADKWHECRSKEMWLRSYLAAGCEDNPFVSMQDVFGKFLKKNLIPLNSKHFNQICGELITFKT